MRAVLLLAVVAAAGCADDQGGFERVGYFRDAAKNRVMTVRLGAAASADEVSRYASGLAYTPGQVTAAYFYPAGASVPADGVTLAGSLTAANGVVYNGDGWRYAYVRGFNGAARFVDCGRDPAHDLCPD